MINIPIAFHGSLLQSREKERKEKKRYSMFTLKPEDKMINRVIITTIILVVVIIIVIVIIIIIKANFLILTE